MIKDVRFSFKYVRPRFLFGFGSFLSVYLIWLALHPAEIDSGHATGVIDLFARSLPTPAKAIFCCALAFLLFWSVYVTFWPCIREGSMVIFDGRSLYGFDFWGHNASILRSEVEGVSFRYGGASVRGKVSKIWVPLSILNTDEAQLNVIKAFLKETPSS